MYNHWKLHNNFLFQRCYTAKHVHPPTKTQSATQAVFVASVTLRAIEPRNIYGVFYAESISWDGSTIYYVLSILLTIDNGWFRRLLFCQFAGGCTALPECIHESIYLKYSNIRVRSDKRRVGWQGDDQDRAAEISATDYSKNCNWFMLHTIPQIITEVKVVLSCDEIFANSMIAYSISCSGSICVTVCMSSGWKVYCSLLASCHVAWTRVRWRARRF